MIFEIKYHLGEKKYNKNYIIKLPQWFKSYLDSFKYYNEFVNFVNNLTQDEKDFYYNNLVVNEVDSMTLSNKMNIHTLVKAGIKIPVISRTTRGKTTTIRLEAKI